MVLYMWGSSSSSSSFTLIPLLLFLCLCSCNLTKHKTLKTQTKHVLQLRKQIKRTKCFLDGWKFPWKKFRHLEFFHYFYSKLGTKAFWRVGFLNIWNFWIKENFVSMLKYCSRTPRHIKLNVEIINSVNGTFRAFLLT